MNASRGHRVAHEFTQTNPAPPEKVFPLLCPVREVDWVPGWNHQLIFSDSGIAERGCVFTTIPADIPGAKLTWITTDYDPAALRVAYLWLYPDHIITELRIQLERSRDGNTLSHIWFRYTGLSPDGNREVETYDRSWFEKRMRGWEAAINYYLLHEQIIPQQNVT